MLLKSDRRTWHLASGQQTSDLLWGCAGLQGWRRISDSHRTGQQHPWVCFTCVFLLSAEELHLESHDALPAAPLGCLCRWRVSRWFPALCRLQWHPASAGLSLCGVHRWTLSITHWPRAADHEISVSFIYFLHLLLLERAFPPPVEFILMRTWSPPGLTTADTTSWTDALTGSIRERGLLSGR